MQAMRDGRALEKIYLLNTILPKQVPDLMELSATYGVPMQRVPAQKLQALNVGQHDGCIAVLSKIIYQDLGDVVAQVMDRGETPLLLLLDGITDIRNIGGIARTAFCTGVHAIIIPERGVGMLNEDALLTSAGALEKLPVCRVPSLLKAIDDLHLHGLKIFASEMTATKTVNEIDFNEPCAVIMGSEEKGIYPALMKAADEKFKIPMAGDFESLNVSVATGMILYEAMKQRGFAKTARL